MLALHLLQSSLVHVNTLLLQAVLEVPAFHDSLDEVDRRGLSPLFWTHINPYGRFRLDRAGAGCRHGRPTRSSPVSPAPPAWKT
jgi:hypothetical protein